MTEQSFVHLRIHTEYSLVDGMVKVKPMVENLRQRGVPAVAITDHNNLFAQIKFYNQAIAQGIKPIIGCELSLASAESDAVTPVVLLAQSGKGYRNLCEILTRGYLDGQNLGKLRVEREWIEPCAEGIIALSGGREGDVGRALLDGSRETAADCLRYWMSVFPDRYYLELHRTGRPGEEEYLHEAVDLAMEFGCPVVATNDVRFLDRDQFEAHEVRVCIQERRTLEDPRRVRRYSEEQYLKSASEMAELFADIPEALENSIEIAKRCNAPLSLGSYYLPDYPVPEGFTSEDYFKHLAREGLDRRLQIIVGSDELGEDEVADARRPYVERLEFELDVIDKMGFAGYFLIVMEFIRWAQENDIPVGPGRGSGAGSIVAYALGITNLDPLKYDLLFERFLNPERLSMPDFDIDFCMEGRDQVIQHVTELYGRDAVSQIITIGTMAAKAVVRDVARVLGKPYGLADKLSKMIPMDPGITLEKALDEESLLREFLEADEDAQEIMEMAFKVEGLARNVGKHAGGVVIAPTRLTDFSPLYCDEGGTGLMTQYDKDDVEQVGLVKFDFLGLRTLTIIKWAAQSVNDVRREAGEEAIDIDRIPLDDPAVYSLLKAARTTAVFQLESRGMKDLIKRLLPDTFDDIVALVALFRPGPMLMADDFINRKHGKDAVDFLHPDLQPVLRNTYGVMLYQEQVMQIAQVLANYSMAEADLLRRAMGKKKPEEMAQQREMFVGGAVKRGIAEAKASEIFELMERFAGYGFNKSHSVAYALIAYQTAWLKTHYPADFMAAVLSADMQNTDKIVTNIDECHDMGLSIVPPDINQGQFRFVAKDPRTIVYGLGAIKGLGQGPIDNIVTERTESGPFADLFEFCQRIDHKRINKRVTEALIGSGALDCLVGTGCGVEGIDGRRALLMANCDMALKVAEQKDRESSSGNLSLFAEEEARERPTYERGDGFRVSSLRERLHREKETLGLYLTAHPIEGYQQDVDHLAKSRIRDLRESKDPQTIAGLVVDFRTVKSRRGDTIAFCTLDDRTGRVEVSLFGEVYEENHEKLYKDALLVVSGTVTRDEYVDGVKMRADEVQSLVQAREKSMKRLHLSLKATELTDDFSVELASILRPYTGDTGCDVAIEYVGTSAKASVRLGRSWRVRPDDDLIQQLREKYGSSEVALDYE